MTARFEYRNRRFWDLIDFDDHWSEEGIYLTIKECPKHGVSKILGFPYDSRCGNIEICIKCLQKILLLATQTTIQDLGEQPT